MSDDLPAAQGTFSSSAQAFWQGFTRPHAGTALGALLLTLAAWIFVAVSSTEARVRATDTARWLPNPQDDWCHLNVVSIQGAERHADGPGQTVVFVGASMLRAILPSDESLSSTFAPAHTLVLAGSAMNYEDEAAVVDKFGGNFAGWFVLCVNRHTMARDLRARDVAKKQRGLTVEFSSAILTEERRRAGLPVRSELGIPLLDHPRIYLPTLGGWTHLMRRPRQEGALPLARSRPITGKEIYAMLPAPIAAAQARNFELLGRIAARLQANGRARLAIVECPFADEALPELHTVAWQAERAEFVRRREAWAQAQGVPWLDVTEELKLRVEDFEDPMHIDSSAVRVRFANAVARRLAELNKINR
ncbi:MAG: hypothetical protein JWM68_782 [Verrucomicrobiales bacterium]|nr:hypothetical protein [Verrucomicrobiales bacterium]